MNKTVLGITAAVIILGGGAFALTQSNDNNTNNQQANVESSDASMEKKDDVAMEKSEEAMEKDSTEKSDDTAMMKKAETFITLAEFESHKDTYNDQKKVLFFHASWCPICNGIEEEITSDPTQIPSNTTFIKTDFDSSTDLRKKYGVTTQYTFVQIDNEGNELDQWSATNLDKAIAGIN
jgi:thioredoxin 1